MKATKWTMALAGTIVMMTLGSVYSWSLFTRPLIAAFGWSNTTTTLAFGLAIFCVGIGAVVGGRWHDRVGPRPVTLTGVALWSAGNVLMGLGVASLGPGWMYFTYSIVGGLGIGMAYVTPVATVVKWFRDSRGLAGGIVVMGFGLGAAVYNLVVKSLPSFAAMDAHAIMQIFVGSGLAFMIVGGSAAWYLTSPPARRAEDHPAADDEHSFSTREMLRTPQFYQLWAMLFVNVSAGILLIGNALPILQELGEMPAQAAAGIVAVVALFNAFGRIVWGAISDSIGGKAAFLLLFGIQATMFMTLGALHSGSDLAAAYALVLLCFGGGFGIMPSFCASYFGTRHLGINYGLLLTAWGAAGLVSPAFSAMVKDATGSFAGALVPIAILLMAATILPLLTRKPSPEARDRVSEQEIALQVQVQGQH